MNTNLEWTVKQCATCLEYQHTQPQEKALYCEILCRPWGVVGADVFMIYGKTLLCIIDYHCKSPEVKKVNSLSVDDLVQMIKLMFAEYGLPKKIVSDLCANFIAETFKAFYRKMNIQQTTISSYHHQSSGLVKAYIKLQHTIKKCFDTNRDIHLALLQIHSTLISHALQQCCSTG